MSQTTSDQLKLINVRAPVLRLLLLAPIALVLAGSWYAARWYVGNTMAEYAPNVEQGGLETARDAVKLAPDDPLTHWSAASLEKKDFSPDAAQAALRGYEEAANLSPNDFRLWLDVGQAREQAGDAAGAEKALRRALELAPAYAYPRWYLGNLLLREKRTDEAFAELQRAAEAYPTFRVPVFEAAMRVYGTDLAALKTAVAHSPATQAELALYLVGRTRVDDALQVWNALSAGEKKEQSATGKAIIKALADARRYRAANGIYRNLAGDGAGVPVIGQATNGGFEKDAGASDATIFDWQIRSTPPQTGVALDALNRHGGGRSLRVVFNASAQVAFNNITQLIAVEPGAQYRLEFYARTKDLRTAGQPIIEIVDANTDALLATSRALPVGTNDWQSIAIDFKTSPKTEAVTIRTGRASCGADSGGVCPIFGIIWYDDFHLQRVGGNSSERRRDNSNNNAAQK